MSAIRLIVIDTETGGLYPDKHCIIEMAAAHMFIHPDEQLITTGTSTPMFHSLVLPDRPVEPQAAAINGYNEESWRNARRMKDVGREFVEWLHGIKHDDLIWAGSNVVGFDLPFLRSDLARSGLGLPGKPKFSHRTLNTESLCFPLFVKGQVEGVGIQHLRRWAGMTGEQTHTAIGDVNDALAVISRYLHNEVWRS